MFRISALLIFLMVLTTCDQETNSFENGMQKLAHASKRISFHAPLADALIRANNNCLHDTLRLEDALLNNHPLHMLISDFEKRETIDSVYALDWMCGSPFDWTDPTKGDAWIEHYITANREYISNGREVICHEFDMTENTLEIASRKISFSASTTLYDFKTLFPVSVMRGYRTTTDDAQFSDCVIYDVLFTCTMDDKWCFYFRNGKLIHVKLWWLLC